MAVVLLLLFISQLWSIDATQLSGTLVVANRGSNSGIVIELPSQQILFEFPTGLAPHQAIPIHLNSSQFLFTDYGSRGPSTLTVGDISTGVARAISLTEYETPHHLEIINERFCIVTVQDSYALVVVDMISGQITEVIQTPGVQCHMVSINPINPSIAACADFFSGKVAIVDLDNGQMVKDFYSGDAAIGVKFHPSGREIWVTNRDENTISIIDGVTYDIIDRLSPHGIVRPIRAIFTPNGEFALVINEFSGDISVFNVQTRVEMRRVIIQSSFRGGPTEIILVNEEFALIADNVNNAVHVLDMNLFEIVNVIFGFDDPEGVGFTELKACEQS